MSRRLSVILALIALLAIALPIIAQDKDDDESPSLFINLTTDEVNHAWMAVFLAQHAMDDKHIPVTIFLNAEGVWLADSTLPEDSYPPDHNPQAALKKFIADGGTVLVCRMCMENVAGITEQELIPGVSIAGENFWSALLADEVRTLSY